MVRLADHQVLGDIVFTPININQSFFADLLVNQVLLTCRKQLVRVPGPLHVAHYSIRLLKVLFFDLLVPTQVELGFEVL